MRCPACQNEVRKYGKGRKGNQRYECVSCCKTFTFSDVKDVPEPSPEANGKKKRVPVGEPYPPWPGEQCGVPEHLWDMRSVWNQHESHDRTHAQRELRAVLKEKNGRLRFLETMSRAQESHDKNLRRGLGFDGAEEIDMGTEEALKILNGWIDEFEAEEAKRGRA